MIKFEQVSSDAHKMSIAGQRVCPMCGVQWNGQVGVMPGVQVEG